MTDLIIPKKWEGKEICICVTEERAVFVYDKEQDKFIDTGETAIELPPHGRLGDLDKVANRMHRYAMACRKNGDPERAELWMHAEEEVRLQGTVVEASTEEKSNGTDR